jgi:hypothetical protein
MTVQKNQETSGKNYFRHQDAESKRKADSIRLETADGAIIISAGGKKDIVTEKIIITVIRQLWFIAAITAIPFPEW